MSTIISNNSTAVFPIMLPTKNSLGSVNFYLVENAHSLTLIDAGYDNEECWDAFQQTLLDQGYTISDLDRIILTHHHIDHIGLVNRILAHHNVPVYAHEKAFPRLKRDREFLMMRVAFFEQLYDEMGCGDASLPYVERMKRLAKSPNGFVINGEITRLPEQIAGFDVNETPGHAVDHVVFYEPGEKWLFAGDVLLQHTSSNALVEPDADGKRLPTLVQHRSSLKKCADLNVEILFPGHQDLFYDHRTLIETRLQRMDMKADKLVELISQGATTAHEMAQKMYKHKYKTQFPFVMSEIIGHLDYLESEGRVFSRLVQGICHYDVG